MKFENRLLLERAVGILDGVSCCNNVRIASALTPAIEMIDSVLEQESVDTIRLGHWVYNFSHECLSGTDAPLNYHCSLCGYDVVQEENYCCNCGAKMEREVDTE